MSSLSEIIERVRGFQPDVMLGLRPPYPPVAIELDRDGATLVRLRPRRRGKPILEGHALCELPEEMIPGSIFQPVPGHTEDAAQLFRDLFERAGTRPGRVSLVIPDNLAKVSLLQLPERPPSARQLDELVRARMRRSVPFRLEEASVAYQLIPGIGKQLSVLVLVCPRGLVERYEKALESIGARVGLVDVSTTNLINLCDERLSAWSRDGKDAALLNCASNYFSLVILRDEKVIFYRCKTYALGPAKGNGGNGLLLRELAGSLSYYREKLAGERLEGLLVRTTDASFDQVAAGLEQLEIPTVEPIAPLRGLELAEGQRIESGLGDRLAPAIGAAAARIR